VKAIQHQLEEIKDAKAPGAENTMEEKRLMNVLYVASAKAKAPAVQEYLETLLVRPSIKPWYQTELIGIKL